VAINLRKLELDSKPQGLRPDGCFWAC